MEGLKLIPYIALLLTIAGVILGAAVIVNSKFRDTMDFDGCFNSTYIKLDSGVCNSSTGAIGSSGKNGLNLSDEGYAIYEAQEGLGTVAEQQPTVAIIAIMVIIISIIAGVFVYMRYLA